MSVSVICPSCGTPATLLRAPVSVCPQCQTAWPEPLRLSAEAALARDKVGRPLLLTIGLYVAPAVGGLTLLFTLSALFNAGTYSINDEPVTGMQFLLGGGLLFGLGGAASVAAAYAIWQERSWSRWAMVGFWVAQLAGGIGVGWASSGAGGAAGAVASLLLPMVLAAWYLFDKENVLEYYRALAKGEAAEALRRGAHTTGGV